MNTSAAAKATRREWVGLGVIALPCLLWIVDIYGFFVAGALITMGTLGDRIGRRRLLMIGAAVYGAALDRASVTQALELTAAISAVIVLGMAAVIVLLLRLKVSLVRA
jgi:DHA2 family multidrug resistance protein-like MFS transporter